MELHKIVLSGILKREGCKSWTWVAALFASYFIKNLDAFICYNYGKYINLLDTCTNMNNCDL